MKRTRMKSMSDKRRAQLPGRAVVRALVFDRDRTCRLAELGHRRGAGQCMGPLTPHHLRKDGQGGAYTLENLVALCAWHNDWIETDRATARELGLVIDRGGDPADAWRTMQVVGIGRHGDPYTEAHDG